MKLFLILMLFISPFLQAQTKKKLVFYKEIIKTLTSDSLQGRATNSVFENKTVNYLVTKWKNINHCQPLIQEFKFKRKNSDIEETSKNIYVYLNNQADSTIVLGAHYDHLGMGEGISRSYGKKGIHHGADDNASGVALLFGLYKDIKTFKNKKYNYVFVNYGAHEIGLFGSAAFYDYCKNNFKPIALLFNFDMVGRLDESSKIVNVYGKQTLQNKTILDILPSNLNINTSNSQLILQTDAKTFVENNIKCLSFTTGIHNDYHKISDTEEKINYTGIIEIEKYVFKLLKKFL
jgi:Peptidase family M28